MKLHRNRDLGKSGIYIIENSKSNKFYIGKAKCIYRRVKWHVTSLNTKSKDENAYMINSWHKHGRDAFSYRVLEYCDLDDDILGAAEYKWMIKLNAIEKGYNMRLDTGTKCILSDETRAKMSKSKIKMYSNPNYDTSKHSHTYWRDNPEAKAEMARNVSKNRTKFDINQYTKDGTLIRTWGSVKEICECNEEFKWQNIYSVCNGYKPSYRGYIWKKIPKN